MNWSNILILRMSDVESFCRELEMVRRAPALNAALDVWRNRTEHGLIDIMDLLQIYFNIWSEVCIKGRKSGLFHTH